MDFQKLFLTVLVVRVNNRREKHVQNGKFKGFLHYWKMLRRLDGLFFDSGVLKLEQDYNAFLLELEQSIRDRLLSQGGYSPHDCPICNMYPYAYDQRVSLSCSRHGYNGLVTRIAARYASIYGLTLFWEKVLGDDRQ